MKLRIIKKQIPGYVPTYHLEEKYFGLFWVLLVWSTDLKAVERHRNAYIKNSDTDSDLGIIWEN